METPLIDRSIFFGNPVIAGAQLSPDGQFISVIKPYNGVLNIWVKERDAPFDTAVPITDDHTRPITSYFWSRDSQYVLYVQDKGGNENFHVYAVKPKEAVSGTIPEARNITDYGDVRAYIMRLPKKKPDIIFIGINDRDPAWHDLYEVSISTGERKLLLLNDIEYSNVYFTSKDKPLICSRSTPSSGTQLLRETFRKAKKCKKNKKGKKSKKGIKTKQKVWAVIAECTGLEELAIVKIIDKKTAYIETNKGKKDLSFLGKINLKTGKIKKIESDPLKRVDLGGAIFSGRTDKLIATSYVGDKQRIYWKDKKFKADYSFLNKHFGGSEVSFTSGTTDEKQWIISVSSDRDPGSTHYFNRKTREIRFLYRSRPNLPIDDLSSMDAIEYPSTDGRMIQAYLTVPDDVEIPCAAIVMPHGGPWVRDMWSYHSYVQFLANRGYAVLQPNYRGSIGFGKDHLNAGNKEWGMKMQDDLTSGAQFLIDQGIADPKRIGILGGSYGGYATLAGLTFTPNAYAVGVSIVGPSNLFTLLESIPAYWESARGLFHLRMGDPSTPEGAKLLRAQSPYFHADKIAAPLLVAQGDNDPRVKTAESNQIVHACVMHSVKVEYLNFLDEGHGFANPQNSMAFVAVMERFLAEHLGGRFQKEIPEDLQAIIAQATVDPKSVQIN